MEPFEQEQDLDGILLVEEESFTNPWTRAMYTWELQNPDVCHIYVVRIPECRVAGFCAFWLVVDEVHVNNVALRPAYRAKGLGTALMRRVLTEARRLGAVRATLEVTGIQPARPALLRGHGLRGDRHEAALLHGSNRGCADSVA